MLFPEVPGGRSDDGSFADDDLASLPDGLPNVGRHAQSVFNVGLYDEAMFWDSRVESLGKEAGQNGASSGIRTPESPLHVGDSQIPVGTTLVAAQARLPVTVPEEMLGSFMPGATPEAIRQRLAERIGDYGAGAGELPNNEWLAAFQTAFASGQSAEQLITFDNIALALRDQRAELIRLRDEVLERQQAVEATADGGSTGQPGGRGDEEQEAELRRIRLRMMEQHRHLLEDYDL